MANNPMSMYKIRQLLLFLDRGFSQRNIEKETGINRRTIAGYLKRFGESGFSFRELLRRLPGIRLAVPEKDVHVRTTSTIFGVKHLPITWDVP